MTVIDPPQTRTVTLTEIPILPATILDDFLGDDGRSVNGVRKLRQELRKEIGSNDRDGYLSRGRHGSMSLEPAPLFTCLAAGMVWDRERALGLAASYRKAGLFDLVASKRYVAALAIAAEAVKKALVFVGPGPNIMTAVVETLLDLTKHNDVVRGMAEEMERITDQVDDQVQPFSRTRGRLVRIEGDDALVVVQADGREQLQELPATWLLSTGISEGGTQFVLHDLSFSPERSAHIVLPAIDLNEEDPAVIQAELEGADSPLPWPDPQ